MIDKKGCDTCEWYFEGACTIILPRVGCVHWEEKGPDLRVRVAKYLYGLTATAFIRYSDLNEADREDHLAHADRLLEIVEEFK